MPYRKLWIVSITALICGVPAQADDRDLLRESSSDPYVFIVFDTSGSMHWAPQCTQAQFDAGVCDYLCPTGDCFVPRNGDDPASKFNQAKAALYEVIQQVEGINFGFASFNQDGLHMRDKHWLYHASNIETKPDGTPNYLTLLNGDRFPDIARHCANTGASCDTDADCAPRGGSCTYEDVFGATWPCDEGNGDRERGCYSRDDRIADMSDDWELRRAQRLPKLGRDPDFTTVATGELRDRFDTASYSNNDGSRFWAGDWIEVDGDGAGPTTGNVRIVVNAGNGELRLDDNPDTSPSPRLARQADLSAFSSAELTFDWRTTSGVDNNDSIVLEISSNGGSSYTTLENFTGLRGVENGTRTYDISSYTSASTRIRFRVNNFYGGDNEFFFVDNLTIQPRIDESVIYLRHDDGTRYKFIYRPVPSWFDGTANVPNAYGNSTLAVELEVRECTNNSSDCASSFVDKQVLLYNLVGDFASWDNGASRNAREQGFFNQGSAGDGVADNTCDGWDDNDDTPADEFSNYLLRWPTDPDPPPLRFDTNLDGVKDLEDFPVGDVIPLDWVTSHQNDVLGRLAPNTIGSTTAVPDFGVASYFDDQRDTGESFLRLRNEIRRPLVSDGATPLGNSIRDFRTWYNGCSQGNCPNSTGWEATAALFDRDFNCRKKFLMVLTDGDNTCSGPSACSGTASLRAQTGIKTFVVAFGVQGGGNTLTCMAANGGTGDPIYPQNKQELVDALLELFNDIKVEARSFASASVPTVQNESSDRIFLSSFTPLPDASVWPGSLNAFRKPLPLKADNTPDFDRSCQALGLQSACHLWDAAEVLRTEQAPTPADVAVGDYRLGTGEDERRVLYSKDNPARKLPNDLRMFLPPLADTLEELDLWAGLGLTVDTSIPAEKTAARTQAEQIIGQTLQIKTEIVPDTVNGGDLTFEYVMGDIFHADPRLTGSPNNLIYFRQNLHDYQDFSEQHFWRRKMLIVGANDGQLHFFDGGSRTVVFDPSLNVRVERFTDGTGRELFAYVPRLVLPIVRDQALDDKHIYSLDGATATADVHIDPKSDPLAGDSPQDDHREWRTVMVSGLREGGDVFRSQAPVPGFVSGYFALDLTQPDELLTPPVTLTNPDPRPIPKPASGTGGNQAPPLVPSCLRLNGADLAGNSSCTTSQGETFPFPAELWSFTDSLVLDADSNGVFETFHLDEERDADGDGLWGNGSRDLGDTWSKPVIGRIRVCTGTLCDSAVEPNDVEERYVAIFGGGLEPTNPNSSQRGAWLYMIDVESGSAIYKRQLVGAMPTTPAVLDRDRDGFFDIIYAGTTQGKLYKVDLVGDGTVPAFAPVTIRQESLVPADPSIPAAAIPSSATVERITDSAWEPFEIFDTGARPIYMTPTAFLVPDLEQFALSFGTGNRHNLWDFDGQEGRFYTIVDEDYAVPADAGILPRTEADYALVDLTGDNTDESFLLDRNPDHRGWYITLQPNEKIITQTFALVGVLVFTSFNPQESVDEDGDGFVDACARSGVSRAFVVDAENANAFVDLDDNTDTLERFHLEGDFTTSIYVDETTTKNPDAQGRTTESQLDPKQAAIQEAIRQALMRFFPKGCRFNKSYSLTINASRSDTGHVRFATIPVAMCAVDWKEE